MYFIFNINNPVSFIIMYFSFVRSVSMDKWKDIELEKMKAGGNRKAKEFFESQSDYKPGMSLQEKYNSRAAALYKDKVLKTYMTVKICWKF